MKKVTAWFVPLLFCCAAFAVPKTDSEKLHEKLRKQAAQQLSKMAEKERAGVEAKYPGVFATQERVQQEVRELVGAPPNAPRKYTDIEAENIARSTSPAGTLPDFDYLLKTDAQIRQMFQRKAYPLSEYENPITSSARLQKTDLPPGFFSWRESQVRDLEAKATDLVRDLLAEEMKGGPLVFSHPSFGNLTLKPKDLLSVSAKIIEPEGEVPSFYFKGISGDEISISDRFHSGGSRQYYTFNLSSRFKYAERLYAYASKRVNHPRFHQTKEKTFQELLRLVVLRDAISLVSQVAFDLEDIDSLERLRYFPEIRKIELDGQPDFFAPSFAEVFAGIQQEVGEAKNPFRQESCEVARNGNVNPRSEEAHFIVDRKNQAPSDGYYKTFSEPSKTGRLKSVDFSAANGPIVESVSSTKFIYPDSRGLIVVPHSESLVPRAVSVHDEQKKEIRSEKDFTLLRNPRDGGYLIRVAPQKNHGAYGFKVEFGKPKKNAPKPQDPVLEKPILAEIAAQLRNARLHAIAQALEERLKDRRAVRLSEVSSAIRDASLYSYGKYYPAWFFGRKNSRYNKYTKTLNPEGVLRTQCQESADLLHEILKHYNELGPKDAIVSRVVHGYLVKETDFGQQVLTNIGHAWVEAGKKSVTPLRLDPTPDKLDPDSPQKLARAIQELLTGTGHALEISPADREQQIARWWVEAERETELAHERIEETLRKLNKELSHFTRARAALEPDHPFLSAAKGLTVLGRLVNEPNPQGAVDQARVAFEGWHLERNMTGQELARFLAELAHSLNRIPAEILEKKPLPPPLGDLSRFYALTKFFENEARSLERRLEIGGRSDYRRSASPSNCLQYYYRIRSLRRTSE